MGQPFLLTAEEPGLGTRSGELDQPLLPTAQEPGLGARWGSSGLHRVSQYTLLTRGWLPEGSPPDEAAFFPSLWVLRSAGMFRPPQPRTMEIYGQLGTCGGGKVGWVRAHFHAQGRGCANSIKVRCCTGRCCAVREPRLAQSSCIHRAAHDPVTWSLPQADGTLCPWGPVLPCTDENRQSSLGPQGPHFSGGSYMSTGLGVGCSSRDNTQRAASSAQHVQETAWLSHVLWPSCGSTHGFRAHGLHINSVNSKWPHVVTMSGQGSPRGLVLPDLAGTGQGQV